MAEDERIESQANEPPEKESQDMGEEEKEVKPTEDTSATGEEKKEKKEEIKAEVSDKTVEEEKEEVKEEEKPEVPSKVEKKEKAAAEASVEEKKKEDKEVKEEQLEKEEVKAPIKPRIKKEKPKAVKPEKSEKKEEVKPETKEEEKKEKEKKEAEESERKWYVVQTFSGQEDRVKESITRNVENMNMQHKIFKVLVPEEETVEIKGGKRIEKVKKMFPGYVFIEMILDEESWYVIRGTPGVAKFIGTKIKPTPVSDKEMQRVLKQIGIKEEKLEAAFEVGESVRIISGPFRGYTGTIDEVNVGKGKLKTLINIFGRDTPVEVNFEQVQKMT